MARDKIHIQPGAWILLIGLVLAGAFFGIKALQKNGTWGKVTNAVAPSSQGSSSVKVTKVGGKAPLVVALNTWCGFAPGVYFNGGLQASENSRFVKEYGVPVQFVIMDNFDDSRNAFKADAVHVICNTADVLPTEAPSMISFKMKVFIQIDWSRGGDKVVVRPGINNVSDLKGKTVALAIGTPSQTLIIRSIETGEVQYSDLIIKKMATALDAATAFKNGQVDAAIVWSPDDEDCLAAVQGSKVLISTKEAAFCIADIFYAKEDYIQSHQKEIKAFTAGWLKAARELNEDPNAKAQAQKLMATCFNVPEAVMNLDNARFTTYGDNVNFFNLMPTQCKCVKGEDLYTKMAMAFNKIGLAPDNVPAWRTITDISILQSLASDFNLPGDAAEEGTTFAAPKTAVEKQELQTKPAIATKRVTINFATGSATVSDDARYIVDRDFSPIARSFSGFRIRIEGNTDNTGPYEVNKSLSRRRAQAVADYLANTYSFDRNRFVIVGNGPDSPVADNGTDEGRAKNRRTDFELIQ
jgi:NitT/TauT family transport system substrate-binding protein